MRTPSNVAPDEEAMEVRYFTEVGIRRCELFVFSWRSNDSEVDESGLGCHLHPT